MGVLGGTFDPVHLGHLASAHDVARAFRLERVLLVLSARPPHKREEDQAPIADRMAMLQLAVADDPLLEACDIEVRRAGLSYTVATLRELAAANRGRALYLIVGVDAWAEVDTWHRSEELLALANVIVTSRPGHEFPDRGAVPPVAAADECCYDSGIGCYVHSSGHRLMRHDIDGIEVSASQIRQRLSEGTPIDDLTGPSVARYAREHGLYGAATR